jgi:hypothetical protein
MNKQDFIMNWQQAKKGQIDAQLILDNPTKNGKGVEQDSNKARHTLLRTGWQQTKAMPMHKTALVFSTTRERVSSRITIKRDTF